LPFGRKNQKVGVLKKNQTKTSAVKSTHACTSWLEEKPKRAL